MTWILILNLVATALRILIWLMERRQKGEPLSEAQREKLNVFIYRAHRIEAEAVPLGCTPGGVPAANDP